MTTTTEQTVAAVTSGTCAHCGWCGLALKKDGAVVRHGSAQTGHPRKSCPGGGKAAAAVQS